MDDIKQPKFGTFIGNCEKDRLDLRLSESTFSLWGYMASHLNEYINPLYRPEIDEIIRPNSAPLSIKFWRGMYGRFESGVHPREPLGDFLLSSRDHCTSLEDHVQHLTKRITSFKNMLSKSAKKLQKPKEVVEINDNKYNYDKKMSDLYSADDDHPLKSTDFSFSNLSVTDDNDDKINAELQSVAVCWKPLRRTTVCACYTPFDQIVRKQHCWRCGDVLCSRCIDRSIALPGHASGNPVPVCRTCYRIVQQNSP